MSRPIERPGEFTVLPSGLDMLSDNLKLDVRAHQRTYEGAYTRSAIGCLSFSLLLIKIFSSEFLPIGIVYTVYGCILYGIGVMKASRVDIYYNPKKDMEVFRTSGDTVFMLSMISLLSYTALLVLVIRM